MSNNYRYNALIYENKCRVFRNQVATAQQFHWSIIDDGTRTEILDLLTELMEEAFYDGMNQAYRAMQETINAKS